MLCRIKAIFNYKPQDIVENSKNISLYGGLGVAYSGFKHTVFNLYYAESFRAFDTAGVQKSYAAFYVA